MKIMLKSGGLTLRDYDVDVYNINAPENVIWRGFASAWKDMCNIRHMRDGVKRYVIEPILPEDVAAVGANAALNLNMGEFCKMMQYLLNAEVPYGYGQRVIKEAFDNNNCLTIASAQECAMLTGKLEPFPVKRYGIFSFHYYSPKDWYQYDLDTITGTARTGIPYDVQDYSQIIKAARGFETGYRPMIWANPIIVDGMIESNGSNVTHRQAQLYAASFIIVAASSCNDIGDDMIAQFWDVLEGFIEDEDIDSLNTLYKESEEYIQSRK